MNICSRGREESAPNNRHSSPEPSGLLRERVPLGPSGLLREKVSLGPEQEGAFQDCCLED